MQIPDYGRVNPITMEDLLEQKARTYGTPQEQQLNQLRIQNAQTEMQRNQELAPIKAQQAQMEYSVNKHNAMKSVATDVKTKVLQIAGQQGIQENTPQFQQIVDQVANAYKPIMESITGKPATNEPADWNGINYLAGSTPLEQRQQDIQAKVQEQQALSPLKLAEIQAKSNVDFEIDKKKADYEHNLRVQEKQQEAKQPKPLTESQANAKLYSSRMNKADQILSTIGSNYSPFAVSSAFSAENSWVPGAGMVANQMLTENDQKAMQAQRDFLNAVLRKESGASISPSEFSNAAKQYFDQPGDSETVKKQKAQNRKLAIEEIQSALPESAKQNDDFAAQFAKMPSGTVYTAPDGTVRRKR